MDKDEEIAELKRRLAALEASANAPTQGVPAPPPPAPSRPPPQGGGCFTVLLWAIGIVVGLVLIVAVVESASPSRPPSTSENSTTPAFTPPSPAETDKPAEPPSNWTYGVVADPMGNKPGSTACTTSTNLVQLDFPYRPVTADLCIRKSRRSGLDAYVTLNGDGQILCDSYDGCTVHVRFDDKPARANSAGTASDNSTNIIFLLGVSRLISDLKASKTTRVELSFYQAGNQTLEFNTAGLVWATAAKKAK